VTLTDVFTTNPERPTAQTPTTSRPSDPGSPGFKAADPGLNIGNDLKEQTSARRSGAPDTAAREVHSAGAAPSAHHAGPRDRSNTNFDTTQGSAHIPVSRAIY